MVEHYERKPNNKDCGARNVYYFISCFYLICAAVRPDVKFVFYFMYSTVLENNPGVVWRSKNIKM